ncbi:MAG: methyltransferase domain-containing protein [Bryobacteraceae bacterium]
MKIRRLSVAILLLSVVAGTGLAQRPGVERLAPFVPSPQLVVERMLEAAEVKPGETVFDLGCGDGRILIAAARDFKAKGVGVELSAELVRQAREEVSKLGLSNRVTILQGDLLAADLRSADVVTLYLLTESNDRLRPILEKSLRPGARVVSHEFKIRGWKPAQVATVAVSGRSHTIYVYQMPPVKD